eukprot:scaffold34915_cov180-Amphora_coffeaeformis.AAC.3
MLYNIFLLHIVRLPPVAAMWLADSKLLKMGIRIFVTCISVENISRNTHHRGAIPNPSGFI